MIGFNMTNGAKKGSRPRGRGPKSMRAPKSMLDKLCDWLAHCKSQVVCKFGSLRTCVYAKSPATADTSQLLGRTLRDSTTELALERDAKFMRTPTQDIRFEEVPGANATMPKKLRKHGIKSVVQLLGVYYTFCNDEEQFRQTLQKMCKVKPETTQCMLNAIGEKAERIRRAFFPDMSPEQLQQLGRGLLRKTRKPCSTARRVAVM